MTQTPIPQIDRTRPSKSRPSDNMPMPYGFGKKSGKKNFTDEQIRYIREEKMSRQEYADLYDCHMTTIREIQVRRTYKHVK